jgi:hypothetical protein
VIVWPLCHPDTIPAGAGFYYHGLGTVPTTPPLVTVMEGSSGTIDLTTVSGMNYPLLNNIDVLLPGSQPNCPLIVESVEYFIAIDNFNEWMPNLQFMYNDGVDNMLTYSPDASSGAVGVYS